MALSNVRTLFCASAIALSFLGANARTLLQAPSCNPCYSSDGASYICCNEGAQCGPVLSNGSPTCVPVVAPKVIIDSDFNTIADDGQVLVMAAQLYARGIIEVLGITVPTGNMWRDQEVVECLKAVERLGLSDRVGVYLGAQEPVRHMYENYLLEDSLFGPPVTYLGAYYHPPPNKTDLVPPPDGFAAATQPQNQSAVDFIIERIHEYPGEVTILAIGPPTNLAAAIEKDPSIVPVIKEIILMGGQINVPGNAFINAAEFNWWFDPDATSAVLQARVPRVIVPLDCTDTLPVTKDIYDQISTFSPPTIITQLYKDAFAPFFGDGPPPFQLYIFDNLALGYLVDPSLATDVRELYVQVNTSFSDTYGRSVVYPVGEEPSGLQSSKVVFEVDKARFIALYVDLMTRPVPVQFAE